MNNDLEIEKAKEVFFKKCKDVILSNYMPAYPIADIKFYIGINGNFYLKTNDFETWNLNDGSTCLHTDGTIFKKKEVLGNKLFLEILKKSRDHDIFLIRKKVLSQGETLESLLIEDDLLEERRENERQP